MMLTGLALPYREPIIDDTWTDRDGQEVRPTRRVEFAHGACTHAIQGNYIEVLVNHAWREHLASTKHGLMLFETYAGLYFHAELPDTPFARSVYDGVTKGTVTNVCAVSGSTVSEDHNGVMMVRRADLTALSLLVNCPPHAATTWIAVGGLMAERRIQQESALAEQRHLGGLQ